MIISLNDAVPTAMLNTLRDLLYSRAAPSQVGWLEERMTVLSESVSRADFYMTYTLIRSRFGDELLEISFNKEDVFRGYLSSQKASLSEVARIYLICTLLTKKPEDYLGAVRKLTEVADSAELITFLKYLFFLPHASEFKSTATNALRTNIEPVFDAIALDNPYPKDFFNEQQWNQMYLKAAFMQRPLLRIFGVEERANQDLSRIISDYAHERWAASRDIDPVFWRPVAFAPVETTLKDIRHLLENGNEREVKAAVLVVASSADIKMEAMARDHGYLLTLAKNKTLNWTNLKQ